MGVQPSSKPLYLLVAIFSCLLICSTAIPVSRLGGLKHGIPRVDLHHLDQDTHMMKEQKTIRSSVNRRMAISMELDDYPGSGANNRHTPRAFVHGCSDC